MDCLLSAVLGSIEKRGKTSVGPNAKRWVSEIQVENYHQMIKYHAFIFMVVPIFRVSVSTTGPDRSVSRVTAVTVLPL